MSPEGNAPQPPEIPSFKQKEEEKKGGGLPLFGKGSGGRPFLKLRGLGGQSSLLERLKQFRRKDVAFIASGLGVLLLAPLAEHFLLGPKEESSVLRQGFDSKGNVFTDAGVPYEPGTGGLSPGGLPGQGTGADVITPLNVRDPAALVMGPGAAQQPVAATPPPAKPESFRDTINEAAGPAARRAFEAAAPGPRGSLAGAIRGLSALSGASFGGGPGYSLPAISASGVPNRPGVRGSLSQVLPAPGFRGVGSRVVNQAGGFDGAKDAAQRQAEHFNRAGGAAAGLEAAAPPAHTPGGRSADGGGGPGGGESSRSPGGNSSKDNKALGESLAFLIAKERAVAAVKLENDKARLPFEEQKALRQDFLKIYSEGAKKIADPIISAAAELVQFKKDPVGRILCASVPITATTVTRAVKETDKNFVKCDNGKGYKIPKSGDNKGFPEEMKGICDYCIKDPGATPAPDTPVKADTRGLGETAGVLNDQVTELKKLTDSRCGQGQEGGQQFDNELCAELTKLVGPMEGAQAGARLTEQAASQLNQAISAMKNALLALQDTDAANAKSVESLKEFVKNAMARLESPKEFRLQPGEVAQNATLPSPKDFGEAVDGFHAALAGVLAQLSEQNQGSLPQARGSFKSAGEQLDKGSAAIQQARALINDALSKIAEASGALDKRAPDNANAATKALAAKFAAATPVAAFIPTVKRMGEIAKKLDSQIQAAEGAYKEAGKLDGARASVRAATESILSAAEGATDQDSATARSIQRHAFTQEAAAVAQAAAAPDDAKRNYYAALLQLRERTRALSQKIDPGIFKGIAQAEAAVSKLAEEAGKIGAAPPQAPPNHEHAKTK